MRKIIDISLSINPRLPVWPGDPPVGMERIMQLEKGDPANVTVLRFGAHTGTHLDAPNHFIHGAKTIDQIELDDLIGPVQVVQIAEEIDLITFEVLREVSIDPAIPKILFKTRNSNRWRENMQTFDESYVGLSESAAKTLVDMGFRLVGIDYLSVAPYTDQTTTHNALLGADVTVLEGLNLSGVEPGVYLLICMPLKLAGSDGAPARVALVSGDLPI